MVKVFIKENAFFTSKVRGVPNLFVIFVVTTIKK